jgi:hypothetical protein
MAAQEMQGQQSIHPRDWSWPFWPAVPLYPYGRRQTLRQEVVKDTVWTFDQLQGILYVVVPIRMSIVKLDAGGFWFMHRSHPPESVFGSFKSWSISTAILSTLSYPQSLVLNTRSSSAPSLGDFPTHRCSSPPSMELSVESPLELARLATPTHSSTSR